jgi:hypothetical protein
VNSFFPQLNVTPPPGTVTIFFDLDLGVSALYITAAGSVTVAPLLGPSYNPALEPIIILSGSAGAKLMLPHGWKVHRVFSQGTTLKPWQVFGIVS